MKKVIVELVFEYTMTSFSKEVNDKIALFESGGYCIKSIQYEPVQSLSGMITYTALIVASKKAMY